MNDAEISIAAIGLAASSVAGIIWLTKYLASTLSKDLQEHTIAATKLATAADDQTNASKEVLVFMKKLNGRLTDITQEKINKAEQQIKAKENL